MVRIRAVDARNILDVCALTTRMDAAPAGRSPRGNAVSVALAKYNPELHPNAIYSGAAPVGFFMYERSEDAAETATILRFMLDDRFASAGLARSALEHILRGLKIQGVRKVAVIADGADKNAENLYISLGFGFVGNTERGSRYELEL